jgi:hypothetical protein
MERVYRSRAHTVAVKITLYLIVWPTIAFHSLLTIPSLLLPPFFILCAVGWWGLGSLLALNSLFLGRSCGPDRATWLGLLLPSILVVVLLIGMGPKWTGYSFQAACVPTSAYWAWLARKGFRF